jgi:Flp pilus assembly pilin Flp
MMMPTTSLLFDLRRFYADDAATTAIEYSLIAGCISIAIIVIAGQVGDSLVSHYYQRVVDALVEANAEGS